MNFVYILQCSDGSYYTGWTNRLQHRLQAHRDGYASKYTRAHLPVQPVLFFMCTDASLARSVEGKIKRLPRSGKIRLLRDQEFTLSICHQWNEEHPPRPLTPIPDL